MRIASSLSAALLLACLASDAGAALLRGDAELVVQSGWWTDVFGNGEVPFDLDPGALAGTHAQVRFWIDTDLLPSDGEADPLRSTYLTSGSDPEWLAMEIEMNSVVRAIGPGERLVETYEGPGPGMPDDFLLVAANRLALLPDDSPYYPESLALYVIVDDFGLGGPIPTDLELFSFHEVRNGHVYHLQSSEFDPTGEATLQTDLSLDFDLLSLTVHPVPEPSALALFALAALALLARHHRQNQP